jgi:hypothetical protein
MIGQLLFGGGADDVSDVLEVTTGVGWSQEEVDQTYVGSGLKEKELEYKSARLSLILLGEAGIKRPRCCLS